VVGFRLELVESWRRFVKVTELGCLAATAAGLGIHGLEILFAYMQDSHCLVVSKKPSSLSCFRCFQFVRTRIKLWDGA
jgi:hypothetical protein